MCSYVCAFRMISMNSSCFQLQFVLISPLSPLPKSYLINSWRCLANTCLTYILLTKKVSQENRNIILLLYCFFFFQIKQFSCCFAWNREQTALSEGCVTLQMSVILQTKDWNVSHRSPGVHGHEVNNFGISCCITLPCSVEFYVIQLYQPAELALHSFTILPCGTCIGKNSAFSFQVCCGKLFLFAFGLLLLPLVVSIFTTKVLFCSYLQSSHFSFLWFIPISVVFFYPKRRIISNFNSM